MTTHAYGDGGVVVCVSMPVLAPGDKATTMLAHVDCPICRRKLGLPERVGEAFNEETLLCGCVVGDVLRGRAIVKACTVHDAAAAGRR